MRSTLVFADFLYRVEKVLPPANQVLFAFSDELSDALTLLGHDGSAYAFFGLKRNVSAPHLRRALWAWERADSRACKRAARRALAAFDACGGPTAAACVSLARFDSNVETPLRLRLPPCAAATHGRRLAGAMAATARRR